MFIIPLYNVYKDKLEYNHKVPYNIEERTD